MERLGLGTTGLGTDRLDVAFEILDAWHAAGGRLIDTAAVYGARLGPGDSERAIGAWLLARGTRDDVDILTKGAHPDLSDWSSRMTPAAIEADLVASLERLGLDAVEAYLVHRDDPDVPVGVVLEAPGRRGTHEIDRRLELDAGAARCGPRVRRSARSPATGVEQQFLRPCEPDRDDLAGDRRRRG